MSKAVLFFADGTEECEALLVADLLRRARVEVIIASAMGRRALVSSHGIHLNADALAEDVDYSDVDMVILPGGIPGTPNLDQCDQYRADPPDCFFLLFLHISAPFLLWQRTAAYN